MVSAETERDQIAKAAGGDNRAFEALVVSYQRAVYALAMRELRNHGDADELAQRTFVQAHKALATYAGTGSFKGWLLRICLNLCRNHRRSASRTTFLGADPERGDVPDEAVALASEQIDAGRRSVRLRAAVAQLPNKQRQAVELRVYQDLPFAEVARVMGGTENAAKVNFHHAVKALKVLLAREEAA